MSDNPIQDLLVAASEQKPVDFQHSFDFMMQDFVGEAIANRKLYLAQTMFNEAVEDVEINEDIEEFLEMLGEEELSEDEFNEAWEQLDELSKKTLGSYINKAADSAAVAHGKRMIAGKERDAVFNATNTVDQDPSTRQKIRDAISQESNRKESEGLRTSAKRLQGIKKATARLTKEGYLSEEDSTPDEDRQAAKDKRAAARLRKMKDKKRYDEDAEIEEYLDYLNTLDEEAFDEEVEQLDELSKKTLVNYMNAASHDKAESERQREAIRQAKNSSYSDIRGPWKGTGAQKGRQAEREANDADWAHRKALSKIDDVHRDRINKRHLGQYHAGNRLQGKFSSVGDRKEVTKMKTRVNNRGRTVTEPKKEIEFTPKKYKGD